jgi:large subunit ribosomal protein L4
MSISVKIYNQDGKAISDLGLSEAIFGLPWNGDLIHQALITAMANKRQVLASTKDRSEVSGGGKKPWKQKGTGRARHGSIRSPLWAKGGITFGPRAERNFKLNINKKINRKAILTALSSKVRDNEIIIFEDLKLASPKTKEMAKVVKNFPAVKNGLLILTERDESIQRAAKNLPNIETTNINNLNVLDILKFSHLIFTKAGIEYLNKQYAVSK